jgi:hypothetical protein
MSTAFKPFRIEDVKELRELVAEHVEGLEPGLRVLDRGLVFGGAGVDLVALDGADALVLGVLGFQADDEMVLRALDAYSWCLEYPEEVRRLVPALPARATRAPRILFVAERMPEAFLRKIKHLRASRVEAVEFRFGLTFTRVAEVRTPEDLTEKPLQPARSEPTANVRPEGPASARGDRATRPEGPPREEALGRESREPAVARGEPLGERRWEAEPPEPREVNEDNVRVVREYLQREFPTAVIYDFYSYDRGEQMFHLQDSHGTLIHSAAVAEDLLAESTEAQLRAFLERHKLARALRQAGTAGVSVSKAGLRIERR